MPTCELTRDSDTEDILSPFGGAQGACQYRRHPCSDKPTHEILLLAMNCSCPDVWYFCTKHAEIIIQESKLDNSHFECRVHGTFMLLIAVNPL